VFSSSVMGMVSILLILPEWQKLVCSVPAAHAATAADFALVAFAHWKMVGAGSP
jgi:hypothetical protein